MERKVDKTSSTGKSKTTIKDFLHLLAGNYPRWFCGIVLLFVYDACIIQYTPAIEYLTNALLAGSKDGVIFALFWTLIIYTASGIVSAVRLRYTLFPMGDLLHFPVRRRLVNKILDLSFRFKDKEQSGDIVAAIASDVHDADDFAAWRIPEIIREVVLFAGLIAILWYTNSLLLILLVWLFPALVVASLLFFKRMYPLSLAMRKQYGQLTSRINENISGVQVVKSFGNEHKEIKRFARENDAFASILYKTSKLEAFLGPFITFVIKMGFCMLLGIGGYMVLASIPLPWFLPFHSITVSQLISFIPTLYIIIEPVMFFSMMAGQYGRAQAAYDRIRKILEYEQDVVEKQDAVVLPDLQGAIEFRNVSFSYFPGTPTLRDISIKVNPGNTVALLGPTGSGKSTIINLLLRFYDINEGAIILDGKWDVRDVNLASFRKQVGLVPQEPFLFQLSIMDNLTYGLTGIPKDAVIEVCKIAKIHDFIASLEPPKDRDETPAKSAPGSNGKAAPAGTAVVRDGYDCIIGERGVTMSGGQRQRLTLARALLRNWPNGPRILVLDDATSSVDVDTEYEILQNLKGIFKQCTTILITQRLSTVRNADYIYVFDAGRVVEEGTHHALMEKKQIYFQLYDTITRSPATGLKGGTRP
nr:ABC transporter ATP-binding protein [Candidatus Sigynarchaeota archaeon]